MLTRKTPNTLATTLNIEGQGETVSFDVVYHNRRKEDIETVLKEAQRVQELDHKDDFQYATRQTVLYIVERFDAEYELSHKGLKEMEEDRPGIIEVLFYGYHQARRVELAKN